MPTASQTSQAAATQSNGAGQRVAETSAWPSAAPRSGAWPSGTNPGPNRLSRYPDVFYRVQIVEDDRVAEQEQGGEKPDPGENQKDAILLFWRVGEHRDGSELEFEQPNLERERLLHVGRLEQALRGLQ